jgi:hypothetical protein
MPGSITFSDDTNEKRIVSSAHKKLVSLAASSVDIVLSRLENGISRTPASHAGNAGSNPAGITTNNIRKLVLFN